MSKSIQVGIDHILSRAFYYWRKTLLYQFLSSVIYFSILLFVILFFAEKYGILDEYIRIISTYNNDRVQLQEDLIKLSQTSEYLHLALIIVGVKAFLFPLQIGLLHIYRKIDLNESPTISDLFIGYSGANFFIFVGYYLFWYMLFSYGAPFVFLSVLWVLLTLFSAPLIFFMKQPLFRTIGINLKVMKVYFIPIIVCLLLSLVFRYSGALVFGVGILLTYFFSTAVVYSLYQTLFKEVRE